ncbi:MAG: DUF2442 domain-containing protein [Verrucomicrobiota bacterium]
MIENFINIISAENLGDYRLRLLFDDGASQTVSFEGFLKESSHPEIRSFLEPMKFAAFRIEYGDLVWGDYELCFPVMDLYRNQINHSVADQIAA